MILGAGLFAEEIASLAESTGQYDVCGFVEGINRDACGGSLLGKPVIWIDELKDYDSVVAVCAVGSPKRKFFIEQARSMGVEFTTLIHPSAQISHGCAMGIGTIVCPGTSIAAGTETGQNVIINRGSLIGHHAIIEEYVTISPGVNMAGKTRIGSGSYIGMSAIILDGLSVGKNSIIGAGALVTRDVPDNVMVMGLPAKIAKRLTLEE